MLMNTWEAGCMGGPTPPTPCPGPCRHHRAAHRRDTAPEGPKRGAGGAEAAVCRGDRGGPGLPVDGPPEPQHRRLGPSRAQHLGVEPHAAGPALAPLQHRVAGACASVRACVHACACACWSASPSFTHPRLPRCLSVRLRRTPGASCWLATLTRPLSSGSGAPHCRSGVWFQASWTPTSCMPWSPPSRCPTRLTRAGPPRGRLAGHCWPGRMRRS